MYILFQASYAGIPSYTFDAWLLGNKTDIELLNDMDKIIFIRESIRGGQSYINTKLAEGTGQ